MKLTQYSDLGLRLLMYLALRYDESATIQEVSIRFAVSKNHMVKISHQLTKSGLIESTRGRNGGVRLARPPEASASRKPPRPGTTSIWSVLWP
jgi:Rrf2 family nitric oxide-sensitive transcriptional repressor